MKAKTTWGIGDYPQMAERLEPVAESAAALAGVHPGSRVLDVGCGTGNFARAAAELGGEATGLDAEPALLTAARSLDRHDSQWRESDFGALDADGGAFDVVASIFGVMYAADHRAALRELARVCAPGGTVVLSAWTPTSFMPAFGRAVAPFLPPPPPSSAPPGRWGDREELDAMLGEAGLGIRSAQTEVLRLDFEDVAQAASFLIRTAGHVLSEHDRLVAEDDWAALERSVGTAVEEHSIATANGVEVPLEYLLAAAGRDG